MRSMRPLVSVLLLSILACFAALAYADPPDPSGPEHGWWDDDDYDTLVDVCLSLVAWPASPILTAPFWTVIGRLEPRRVLAIVTIVYRAATPRSPPTVLRLVL